MHYNTAKANEHEQLDKRRALRREMTLAETLLWRVLRGRGEGRLRWRRQQGIGPYILDFYCAERRLCIELDGNSHDYKYEYDERRTEYLEAQGIRVMRFTNDQVTRCLDGVVAEIYQAAGYTPPPAPVGEGPGAGSVTSEARKSAPLPPTPPLTGAGGSPEKENPQTVRGGGKPGSSDKG